MKWVEIYCPPFVGGRYMERKNAFAALCLLGGGLFISLATYSPGQDMSYNPFWNIVSLIAGGVLVVAAIGILCPNMTGYDTKPDS